MTDHTHASTPTAATDDAATTPTAATSVPPTVVVQPADRDTRKFHFGSFIAGFLAAIVVAALGLGVFLAVSDSDDDGNLQVDVPAVNVDIGG